MPSTFSIVWIIGGVIVLAVLVMSIVFLIKSIKRAKAIGMETSTIKKIITSSAVFSIVPSIPIVIGVGILMSFVGMGIAWIRLSVIGALQYEIFAQQLVFNAGAGIDPIQLIGTSLLLMTFGIVSGPIFNAIAYKKYQGKLASIQEKNSKLMDGISGALMGGMLSGMISSIIVTAIFNFNNPITDKAGITTYGEVTLIALCTFIVLMALCGVVLKVFKQKWIENYALPISMLGAMAVAYACVPLFA